MVFLLNVFENGFYLEKFFFSILKNNFPTLVFTLKEKGGFNHTIFLLLFLLSLFLYLYILLYQLSTLVKWQEFYIYIYMYFSYYRYQYTIFFCTNFLFRIEQGARSFNVQVVQGSTSLIRIGNILTITIALQ